VLGDGDVIGGEIKTSVDFVINGVFGEYTSDGFGWQFVRGSGGEIGIAGATEHVQVLIWGGGIVEGDIWTSHSDRLAGEAIQQICGGVKPFYTIVSQNRSLKKQGAHHIINGAENVLGFTILWRSVWATHPQNHPISGEEYARGSVVELTTIVTLDDFDGAAKLCGDISEKINKLKKVSNLTRKEKIHKKYERSSRITK
jgi:hypothetical protein